MLAVLALAGFPASPAAAATPAPPFTQCPALGADTSCALLIYIDSQSRVAVLGDPSQGPYDSIEDTLIGVQNDSPNAIASIPLSATTGKPLFGFDGDGLCTFLADPGCPFGSTGYEGPGTSFTNISADFTSGTVVFSPALKPGQHTYFSLEEALATVPPFDLDPGPPAPADHMVALGDSYSAGEGLGGDSYKAGGGPGSYLTGTNTVGNECHRHLGAYGPQLDNDLALGQLTFVACSGAVTADLVNDNHNNRGEPPQFDALDASVTTVTLTIGGNDAGFSSMVRRCVFGRLWTVLGPFGGHAGCSNDKALDGLVKAYLAGLAGTITPRPTSPAGTQVQPIADLLAEAHRRAPNAKIFLGGYPAFFGRFYGECAVGGLTETGSQGAGVTQTGVVKITSYDAAWINQGAALLNATIKKAAAQVAAQGIPVTFVDVDPYFAGHRLCDSGTSWIHPISGTTRLGHEQESHIFSGSLHPTAEGQRSGYEAAFAAAMGIPPF